MISSKFIDFYEISKSQYLRQKFKYELKKLITK